MATLQKPIHSGLGATTTAREVLEGVDLSGKIAIVTGGHSGIGWEMTKALSKAGARVIVGARNPERAESALLPFTRTEVFELDLSLPESVNAFVNRYRKSHRKLDILINNAGIMATPLLRNKYGYELQFATNHMGHFQLTTNLWAQLRRAEGRVVTLSSIAHHLSGIQFEDPNFQHTVYDKWKAYGQSKTANSLFAVHFDKIGAPYNIRSFAVHPGRVVSSGIGRHLSEEDIRNVTRDAPGIAGILPYNIKSAAQGAATAIWCATSQKLTGIGGVYCADCNIAPMAGLDEVNGNNVCSWAIDPLMAKQLWTLTEELLDKASGWN